jgi:hypothetical protein
MHNAIPLILAALLAVGIIVIGCFYLVSPETVSATFGDGNAPAYLQLANIWMILNVGGGPTPDKPNVILSVPDPNHMNSFTSALRIFKRATAYGRSAEQNSSPNRFQSTAKSAATFAT